MEQGLGILNNGLTFDQQMKVLQKWYECQSGLQAMSLAQNKELELIKRSNAIAVIEANGRK